MHQVNVGELARPFFARESTKRFISRLGSTESLAIYLGAGASIDRTGRTWKQLLVDLLKVATSHDEQPLANIANVLDPMSLASIAAESYKPQAEDPSSKMCNDVKQLLYEHGGMLRGRALTALSDVAIELARRGQPTTILTTNFDDYLYQDFEEQVSFWSDALSGGAETGAGESVRDAAERTEIVPLHGLVRQREEAEGGLVLSEEDYVKTAETTRQRIATAINDRSLLTLGASLTDPPLVRALLDTKQKAQEDGRVRYALLPRSDVSALAPNSTSVSTLNLWQSRLSHLGVQGIFVDSFSQMGQFLREMHIALHLDTGDYPNSPMEHGRRLSSWWESWWSGMPDKYEERQGRDHGRLCQLLEDVRGELGVEDEGLKIEVWLRWQPGNSTTGRALRLWASSYSRFTEPELTRSGGLADLTDTRYVAVRAFREGRPICDTDDQSRRWKAYLAAPIELAGDVNLVVGSVVVSSMDGADTGALSEKNRAMHARVLQVARPELVRIASAGQELRLDQPT